MKMYTTTNAYAVNMNQLILPLLKVKFLLYCVFSTLLYMLFISSARKKKSFAASKHFCPVIQGGCTFLQTNSKGGSETAWAYV